MPQAGVALGLIAVASSMVPDYAPQLRTVILCSTFIYSIIGPGVAKFSLVKAGEIVLPDKKQKKSEHNKSLHTYAIIKRSLFYARDAFLVILYRFCKSFFTASNIEIHPERVIIIHIFLVCCI